MKTYWDTDKAGGLPSYLGNNHPTKFIQLNGDDCVVRMDIGNGGLTLFDKPGPDGVAFASRLVKMEDVFKLHELAILVFDMVELHSEDWGK